MKTAVFLTWVCVFVRISPSAKGRSTKTRGLALNGLLQTLSFFLHPFLHASVVKSSPANRQLQNKALIFRSYRKVVAPRPFPTQVVPLFLVALWAQVVPLFFVRIGKSSRHGRFQPRSFPYFWWQFGPRSLEKYHALPFPTQVVPLFLVAVWAQVIPLSFVLLGKISRLAFSSPGRPLIPGGNLGSGRSLIFRSYQRNLAPWLFQPKSFPYFWCQFRPRSFPFFSFV